MFSFVFLAGDQTAPLAAPNGMVITRSIAQKYFGHDDPIGKIMKVSSAWVDTDYIVASVIEDVPANSHFDFDFILSIRSLLQQSMYAGDGGWGWQNFTTYVRLHKGAEIDRLHGKMPNFLSNYVKSKMEASFQPLVKMHTSPGLAFETTPTIGLNIVYFFLIIAFFILVIAWINYINLTTARAMERSREVGIKKAVGADKRHLISQFMLESAIVNLFAAHYHCL
jgi:putative ABC transport system permease protein